MGEVDMTDKYPIFDKALEDLMWPHGDYTSFTWGVLYNDIPKPNEWLHPIKWFKWRYIQTGEPIGFVAFDSDFEPSEGDLTITWGPPDKPKGWDGTPDMD